MSWRNKVARCKRIPEVWELLDSALRHLGSTPVLIERDAELPPFSELLRERDYTDQMIRGLEIEEAASA